jgi:hypothetical protein
MVLIVLIVLWSIVLIPPAWQSHAEARRARSVDAFRRRLSVLAPAPDTPLARRPVDAARPFEAARAHVAVMAQPNVVALPVAEAREIEYDTGEVAAVGAGGMVGRSRAAVLRRRRQVLGGLAALMVVTLSAGFLPGLRWAWAFHGLLLAVSSAYVTGLRRLRRLALERRAKVRYLPAQPPVAAAGAGQRRTGEASS